MHYTCHVDLAFAGVEHIMRDVNNGWLVRYIHTNGALMFFNTIYVHMFKNLYGSYAHPRAALWCSGVIIFLIAVLTAFLGYVLPWGQMSLWGATVITNLVSAVPLVGTSIVEWLWGGFSVDNATLNRFFSFPLFISIFSAGLTMAITITPNESNNPLGVDTTTDKMPFYPWYS